MAAAPANDAEYYAQGYRLAEGQNDRADEEEQRKIANQRAAQEFQLKQQAQQQQQAQEGAALQLHQKQLEQQATQSAQKYQAQQAYQQAIAAGMDPTQAILKFGPMIGAGGAVGGALRAQTAAAKPKPVPFVPGPVKSFPVLGPDGQPVPNMLSVPNASGRGMETRNIPGSDQPGYVSPRERLQNQQKATADKAQAAQQKQLQQRKWTDLRAKKRELQKAMDDDTIAMKAARAKAKAENREPTQADRDDFTATQQKQMDAIDQQLDQLEGAQKFGGEGGGDLKAPTKGDVVKGYTFAGGDPSDKANWTKAEGN